MSENIMVACIYAEAAFSFAIDKNDVDNWLEMLKFSSEITNNSEFSPLLKDYTISEQSLVDLFVHLFKNKINNFFSNFINIIVENERLSILPEIYQQFIKLKSLSEGIVDVDVISSFDLNRHQMDEITIAMKNRLSRDVKLNCIVDHSVIGGIKICTSDFVIDATISNQLKRLTSVLQS